MKYCLFEKIDLNVFLGVVSIDESQKDVNLPDNSEENLVAAEVVVAPTVENGQQINVNKDVVDNTYEIYIYNAKEPSTNKNASNSENSGSNTQGYIDIRFALTLLASEFSDKFELKFPESCHLFDNKLFLDSKFSIPGFTNFFPDEKLFFVTDETKNTVNLNSENYFNF